MTLVEFSLVLPIFLATLIAVIEFAFMFNASLAINFASRDASLIAAEAGNNTTADCVILQKIESLVTAPADRASITEVRIYQASTTGTELAAEVYSRGGSTTCGSGLSAITVPYTLTSDGYPADSRCNDIQGCPVDGSPGTFVPLDTVGVKISYHYVYKTPLSNLATFLGGHGRGPAAFDLSWANVMRMEPIL